jgi:hypothetical protein
VTISESFKMKLKSFSLIQVFIGVFFLLILFIAFLGWLFWGLFIDRLRFWHVLLFVLFNIAFCAWFSYAKNLRERHLSLRIIEQLVAMVFFAIVVLFLAGII